MYDLVIHQRGYLTKFLRIVMSKLMGMNPFFVNRVSMEKNHVLPFNLSASRAKHPLELIHTDVWGPAHVQSTSGFKF